MTSRYDCPHCGKFHLSLFCEHCGKPTESRKKYRITFSIGLLFLPLITLWCYINMLVLLPEVAKTSIVSLSDLRFMATLMLFLPLILGTYHLLDMWIGIEFQFRDYYKKIGEKDGGRLEHVYRQ